jgi:hypothetical protein
MDFEENGVVECSQLHVDSSDTEDYNMIEEPE